MCAVAAASGTEIVMGMGYLVDQLFFLSLIDQNRLNLGKQTKSQLKRLKTN